MADKKPVKSYNELNKELDEIIEWFESGDLNIDQALPNYEAAMKLIMQLEAHLKDTENKIRKLNIDFKSE